MNTRRAFTLASLVSGTLLLSEEGTAEVVGKLLTKKQVADLVATAKTAADHRRLAAHYRAVAANHELEAQEHLALAAKYKANPTTSESKRPGAPDTAAHCLMYAEHCRNAAKVMNEMAAMHEEMAKNAK